MEISLVNREIPAYQTGSLLRKRTQVTAECVVPDSQEDVGKIASVCSSLYLKGKDLSPHGVSVSGEVQVMLLYVTEDGQRLASLRFARPFTMDFETEEPDPQALPQIRWSLAGTEVRILNSRKLSLCFDISAELSQYSGEAVTVESSLPEGDWEMLHVLAREQDAMVISCVTEKTFSIHEQFPFPGGKGVSADRLGADVRFRVLDTEQVGSRAIVKGEMLLTVQGISEPEGQPFRSEFRSPFSQLLEVGESPVECFDVTLDPSSAYFDVIDTISGEKSLDAEIHGVVQLVAWSRQTLHYLVDAYSNQMPCEPSFTPRPLITTLEMERCALNSEETLNLSEDCADVLSIQPTLGPVEYGTEQTRVPVNLDVIIRSREGSIVPLRRSLNLEGKGLPQGAQIGGAWFTDCDLRPEGDRLKARMGVEIAWRRGSTGEIQCLNSMTLRDDMPFDRESWPGLSLVRADGEDLWSLAKSYHGSIEQIEACNTPESRMLLIPCEQ